MDHVNWLITYQRGGAEKCSLKHMHDVIRRCLGKTENKDHMRCNRGVFMAELRSRH